TRSDRDWSSDVCSSDLLACSQALFLRPQPLGGPAFPRAKAAARLRARKGRTAQRLRAQKERLRARKAQDLARAKAAREREKLRRSEERRVGKQSSAECS